MAIWVQICNNIEAKVKQAVLKTYIKMTSLISYKQAKKQENKENNAKGKICSLFTTLAKLASQQLLRRQCFFQVTINIHNIAKLFLVYSFSAENSIVVVKRIPLGFYLYH